ncbi:hypothetical protein PVAP13_6KG150306 [Panicum virgatum]|uniref:Uncharacterized protein n=1 Tax=Panicum virgatum TaxID=38727 RepID=A0A8T0RDS9_PANVG|nr:hypothetical protein PVAP13_6KG150306 [Panicum virgatum]
MLHLIHIYLLSPVASFLPSPPFSPCSLFVPLSSTHPRPPPPSSSRRFLHPLLPPSPLSRHHLSCCLPSLPSHYLIFLPVTSPAGSATIARTLGRARQWHLAVAEGPCGAARQQSVASAMHGAMRGRARWLRQHRRFLNQR